MFDPEKLLMPDRGFGVELDEDGCSRNMVSAVWRHQTVCVSEENFNDRKVPKAGWDAIERELGFGHWDVIAGASASVSFTGFPHSVAMQFRTHKSMSTTEMLCQSMRFTGKRFQAPKEKIDLDKVFYRYPSLPMPSDEQQSATDAFLWHSVTTYQKLIADGHREEDARNYLASGYRQDFHIHGTLQAWFHILDRRTLADTQAESRCAAAMAIQVLRPTYPELWDWYIENRAGRNKLSP